METIERKLTVKIFASKPSTSMSLSLRCCAIPGQLFGVGMSPRDLVLFERIPEGTALYACYTGKCGPDGYGFS